MSDTTVLPYEASHFEVRLALPRRDLAILRQLYHEIMMGQPSEYRPEAMQNGTAQDGTDVSPPPTQQPLSSPPSAPQSAKPASPAHSGVGEQEVSVALAPEPDAVTAATKDEHVDKRPRQESTTGSTTASSSQSTTAQPPRKETRGQRKDREAREVAAARAAKKLQEELERNGLSADNIKIEPVLPDGPIVLNRPLKPVSAATSAGAASSPGLAAAGSRRRTPETIVLGDSPEFARRAVGPAPATADPHRGGDGGRQDGPGPYRYRDVPPPSRRVEPSRPYPHPRKGPPYQPPPPVHSGPYSADPHFVQPRPYSPGPPQPLHSQDHRRDYPPLAGLPLRGSTFDERDRDLGRDFGRPPPPPRGRSRSPPPRDGYPPWDRFDGPPPLPPPGFAGRRSASPRGYLDDRERERYDPRFPPTGPPPPPASAYSYPPTSGPPLLDRDRERDYYGREFPPAPSSAYRDSAPPQPPPGPPPPGPPYREPTYYNEDYRGPPRHRSRSPPPPMRDYDRPPPVPFHMPPPGPDLARHDDPRDRDLRRRIEGGPPPPLREREREPPSLIARLDPRGGPPQLGERALSRDKDRKPE